jgi:predicted O-linked N-acetylglucosamine transferase (SPINDLY family)
VRLPDTFQPNDDRRTHGAAPPSRAEAGLPEHAFVFCSFNAGYKLTPALFDVWVRILTAVPDSVLWLVAGHARAQRNLAAEAEGRGVDPARLVFAPRVPYDQHLARFAQADLFLDTVPFNAGTTASDALWMGLPLLTCTQEAFAARMAGSLLHALGVPELVTADLRQYEARAVELAADRPRLAALRARIVANRATSPLFDTDRYRRHIEDAYLATWARHARGEPPADLDVPPR